MRRYFYVFLLLFIGSTGFSQDITYPPTPTVDSSDRYFGIHVKDPYRWLENDSSAETKSWVIAENKITDDYMSKIPFRNQIKKELTENLNFAKMTAPIRFGDWYYFYRNSGLQNQNVVYRVKDPADTAKAEVFLDPNSFARNGSVSLQGYSFSEDFSLYSYLISNGGSDWREVIVRDTRSNKQVGDTIRNVKFSGSSWYKNEGFYYTTYEIPAGQNKLVAESDQASVYYHKIGTPQSEDRFIYGGKEQPHRYINASVSEDQRYLVISTAESTYGNHLYIRDLDKKEAPVQPVFTDGNASVSFADNKGDVIYLVTDRNAPNYKLVRVNAANPGPENWKDMIPETGNPVSITSGGGYFFASYMVDVKSLVIQYDFDGNKIREIKLPAAGSAFGFGAYRNEKELFYTFISFTYPNTIYHLDLKSGESTFYNKPAVHFNPDDFVTKQVFYTSKDSTKIPMYIVYKKGIQFNGKNPVYLYAYGGFNISLIPSFSANRMVWLEHGGIYAQPNLRGGGEYGKKWHMAGTLMQKQNVFDDFIAAGEYLIREKYTSSPYLAIAGGSNGGLLVGATMTQRPDLMRVALPSVGVLDMIRYHKFTAGAGWASDYGRAGDSIQMLKYLMTYSPLQNVKPGVRYPATFIWTADHDDRVVPGHSLKFAATLQKDNAGDNPILISIQHNAGHGTGMTTDKVLNHSADEYAFIWYSMGIDPFK
jgi:prolyl oligopeptidase